MIPISIRVAVRLLPSDAREAVMAELLEGYQHVRQQRGDAAARRWAWRQPWAAAGARLRYPNASANRSGASLQVDIWSDVVVAARGIRRRPGVAAAVVATIALSIAALAAIAGLIDAVLLRPLPYPDADRLVALQVFDARSPETSGWTVANPQDVMDWRARATTLAAVTAIENSDVTVQTGDGPVRASAASVNATVGAVIGVRAARGRLFDEADSSPGARVAILTDTFWRSRFGSDPTIVGRAIPIDGTRYTVVGILPPLIPLFPDPDTDVWLPLPTAVRQADPRLRGGAWQRVVARIKPQVTRETAQAEMRAIAAALGSEFPKTNATRRVSVVRFRDVIVGDTRTVLVVTGIAVALVMFVACANVGHLLLVTAQGRRQEFAVRTALGASPGRLVRLTLIESAILAAAGAAAGLLAAPWLLRLFVALYPGGLPAVGVPGISGRALAIAMAGAVLAALTSSLPPLLLACRLELRSAMHSGSRAGDSRGQRRIRTAIVLAQVAVCTALLVAGGLFVRSFWTMRSAQFGFATDHLLTFNVALERTRYPDPASEGRFYQELSRRLGAIPGVSVAGSSSLLPLAQGGFREPFTREGYEDAFPDLPRAELQNVTPGFLEALGVPLAAGRRINDTDRADSAPVADVNEAFQRRFFPGGALGRHIRLRRHDIEIVGIVGDASQHGPREPLLPDLYLPRTQSDLPRWFGWVLVRTRTDPSSVAAAVRQAVRNVDPSVSLADLMPMTERVDALVAPDRFRAATLGALGVTALLLAAIGLYGLIAHSVSLRARDVAIRMALGADAGRTAAAVILEMLALTGSGIAVGLVLAAAAARLIQASLLGVGAYDPITFAAVPVVLLVVALLAAASPARRASRIDPLVVLRDA